MGESFRILVINPGSTSTKIAVFENRVPLLQETIRHSTEEIMQFNKLTDQFNFRKQKILTTLDQEGLNVSKLDAICSRGGLLKPIEGGTYLIGEQMIKDLKNSKYGEHASNLGGLIAKEFSDDLNIPAYIVDPVVVDELQDIARISGIKELPRKSIFHALNQKSVARKACDDLRIQYESSNMVVCHMGGGITIGVHQCGKVIDVNNGLDGEGPFTPERAGTLPAGQLVDICFSGQYSKKEIKQMLVGQGGLVNYLGTNDAVDVEERIASGDQESKLIYEAMAYQIAKEIGAASTVLKGNLDAIVLTGGLAYGKQFIQKITERIHWIADVLVYPGENEMEALADGALRVLNQQEQAKIYR